MSLEQLAVGLLCVCGISIAQILFKIAAIVIVSNESLGYRWRMLLNPYILINLFIYCAATLLWIWLLRFIDLRLAYPLMALAFVIVPILGRVFLKEELRINSILGAIIIIIGVYISVG